MHQIPQLAIHTQSHSTMFTTVSAVIMSLTLCVTFVMTGTPSPQPNIVLIVGDDVGVGDLSCYGHPSQEWGAIDRMASQGIRFTQAYSSAHYCTPSRASFLTGRQPFRTGLVGPEQIVEYDQPYGLPHSEVTIAEGLKDVGYRTGIVGKWHLGINAYTHNDGSNLPHTQGFDYVGSILPHTLTWACDTWKRHIPHPFRQKCFLYQNTSIVQQPLRTDNLTAQLVMDAKAFIYDSIQEGVSPEDQKPFFLYYSLLQTHTPMFNDERFKGKSRRGIYGDQINEMAWPVEEVLDTLQELNIHRNTLTIFISDHGPQREICGEGGSPGFFKGGKGFLTEGGLRVPVIARWPGVIPAGIVDSTVISLMDLFPTFLSLAGGTLPQDRHIDGKDLSNILLPLDKATSIPHHEILYFYCNQLLVAVRYSHFKIYFYDIAFPSEETLRSNCRGDFPLENIMFGDCNSAIQFDPVEMYNVDADPREMFPLLVDDHSDMLHKVHELIEGHKKSLTDIPEPVLYSQTRTGKVLPCCNYPYCLC